MDYLKKKIEDLEFEIAKLRNEKLNLTNDNKVLQEKCIQNENDKSPVENEAEESKIEQNVE